MSTGSKKEKREKLRQERAAREAAEAQKAKRKRLLLQLGGITGVAAVIVAVLIVISLSGNDKSKKTDSSLLGADTSIKDTGTAKIKYKGAIPQKGLVLGDPNAPITVVEFADLQCPHCRDYTLDVFPGIVRKYVRTGQVKMELRFFNVLGPDSEVGAQFAYGVAQQNKLWQFTDTFYHNQEAEGSGYITDDFLRDIAKKVPGLNVQKAFVARDSAAAQKLLKEGGRLAREANIDSTPTFLVSKKDGDVVATDFSDLEDEIKALLE